MDLVSSKWCVPELLNELWHCNVVNLMWLLPSTYEFRDSGVDFFPTI